MKLIYGMACIILLGLSGCGQIGDLYLPEPGQEQAEADKKSNHGSANN